MIEKLKELAEKYDEIKESLSDPDIVSDIAKYTALMKEYKNLTPIAEKYKEYEKTAKETKEAEELLNSTLEKDFKEMVEEEYLAGKEKLSSLENELKILLLPKDPNDEKNVIMEIRGGAGGEEAALFAAELFRMYSMYAEKKGYKVCLLYTSRKVRLRRTNLPEYLNTDLRVRQTASRKTLPRLPRRCLRQQLSLTR